MQGLVIDNNNPYKLFGEWFDQAKTTEPKDWNAMTLATVDKGSSPKVRTVLLKGYSDEGFEFFTNYNSQKAKALENNPNVSICFYWKSQFRQIIIDGKAEPLSKEKSKDYFLSRDRNSQIGAYASKQSQPLASRDILVERSSKYDKKFSDEIPYPDFWGGYLIKPNYIEFWQEGDYRLHDRFCFKKNNKGEWEINRLYP